MNQAELIKHLNDLLLNNPAILQKYIEDSLAQVPPEQRTELLERLRTNFKLHPLGHRIRLPKE